MKTIVRVGGEDPKLAPFASAMLADAFAKKGGNEGLLVVEQAQGGKQVYVIVSPHPPEIVHGDRRVWAVFAKGAQEPLATFALEADASAWSMKAELDTEVREIDSTDRVNVRVGVSVVIKRAGTESTLYARLKSNKQWTIPEVLLTLGESVEGAARRAARELVGLEIGQTQIPHVVPYVNAYVPDIGHFLSLVLIAECDPAAEPELKGASYDALEWGPAGNPPEPQFLTMRAIRMIVAKPVAVSDEPIQAVRKPQVRGARRKPPRSRKRRSRA